MQFRPSNPGLSYFTGSWNRPIPGDFQGAVQTKKRSRCTKLYLGPQASHGDLDKEENWPLTRKDETSPVGWALLKSEAGRRKRKGGRGSNPYGGDLVLHRMWPQNIAASHQSEWLSLTAEGCKMGSAEASLAWGSFRCPFLHVVVTNSNRQNTLAVSGYLWTTF